MLLNDVDISAMLHLSKHWLGVPVGCPELANSGCSSDDHQDPTTRLRTEAGLQGLNIDDGWQKPLIIDATSIVSIDDLMIFHYHILLPDGINISQGSSNFGKRCRFQEMRRDTPKAAEAAPAPLTCSQLVDHRKNVVFFGDLSLEHTEKVWKYLGVPARVIQHIHIPHQGSIYCRVATKKLFVSTSNYG